MSVGLNPAVIPRLYLLYIEQNGLADQDGGLEKAMEMAKSALSKLRLFIHVDASVASTVALQAALLTMVNTGVRAFKGGVYVQMKGDNPCLVPGFQHLSLHEAVNQLGISPGWIEPAVQEKVICLGSSPANAQQIGVFASGWQALIKCYDDSEEKLPKATPDFALGGNLAGSLAVGFMFLEQSGINIRQLDQSFALSLWRPDLDGLATEAEGPDMLHLPTQLHLLGLGHLGQAYGWVGSQLPYNKRSEVSWWLQDDDPLEETNLGAALLSQTPHIGQKKTRIVSAYLEKMAFQTSLIEHRMKPGAPLPAEKEPWLFGGTDSAKARAGIDTDHFAHYLDIGLGGTLGNFDGLSLHNFLYEKQVPAQVWKDTSEGIRHSQIEKMEQEAYGCGQLAEKAISTAFVGVVAACFAWSELLRHLHEGKCFSRLDFQLREKEVRVEGPTKENVTTPLALPSQSLVKNNEGSSKAL